MKYEDTALWDKQSLKDYICTLIDENFDNEARIMIGYGENELVIE